MVVGDERLPGLLHYVFVSNFPYGKQYKSLNGIMVDVNIRDVGSHILEFVHDYGYNHISLLRDVPVSGRSWEMACANAVLERHGVYSGTVEDYSRNEYLEYGIVPGLDEKRKLFKKIYTANDIRLESLSR